MLNRAVAWGLIDYNPAKRGVPNPARRAKEKRPFETWEQVEAVAGRLGPVYGAMVVFAAATGVRPSELFALEHRDIDRAAGVVYVRRAYANGRLKHTKTRLSTRAVTTQLIALEALDRLPVSENPILFPNSRQGRIDFRSFGRRRWKPAQTAAGIEPLRHLYDLRHTYATFALRAGVSVFAVSRFMGSSIAMIDYHYGHLSHAAVSTPSHCSTPSRSKERWTLGGRRNGRPQDRSATPFLAIEASDRAEPWTFGGRRNPESSSPLQTKGADQQELREAL